MPPNSDPGFPSWPNLSGISPIPGSLPRRSNTAVLNRKSGKRIPYWFSIKSPNSLVGRSDNAGKHPLTYNTGPPPARLERTTMSARQNADAKRPPAPRSQNQVTPRKGDPYGRPSATESRDAHQSLLSWGDKARACARLGPGERVNLAYKRLPLGLFETRHCKVGRDVLSPSTEKYLKSPNP